MNEEINQEVVQEVKQEHEDFLVQLEGLTIQALVTGNWQYVREAIDWKEEDMKDG